MAYDAFTDGKPVSTDTGLQAVDYMRENLMALRDAIAMGSLYGWDYSKTDGTGTAEQPQYIYYSRSTNNEALRGEITWGTTGGSDGNPTQIDWHYTADDTAGTPTWDEIGRESITYDASANVTAVSWGAIV